MQKLKSFGCSFIFGDDLQDADVTQRPPQFSQYTWPALLAKEKQLSYTCHALGGSGNLRILETVLQELSTDSSKNLYVIGWTWIDRYDYKNAVNNDWQRILPTDNNSISEYYYKNLHSQYQDKLQTLIYINAAITALKNANQQFIMTAMDDLIFETEWHSSPAIKYLQDSVKDYITTFDGLSFLEWSRKNNYPISAAWHPLEAAHQAAFEYIKNQSLV